MFFGHATTYDNGCEQKMKLIRLFNKRFCIYDKTLYKVTSFEKRDDKIISLNEESIVMIFNLEPIFSLRRNK